MKKRLFSILAALCMICTFLPTNASAAWSNNYTLTGNQAQDIVNIAVAQAGKNGQDLNYNVAWCAYFVYDCAKRANVNGIPHEGVASSMFRKATQNGLEGNYFTDVTSQNSSWTGGNGGGMQRNYDTQYCSGMNSSNWTPQMGDIVFFTRKGCGTIYHVGIVQYASGNTIYVVHGNWSSKVVANYAITRGQYHSSRSGDYAICAYVRPNYSGSAIGEVPQPVGTTSAPRVSVDGQNVSLSWDYNGSGTSFDAYLVQEPWGWADIKYHISTQSRSCTFANVTPGEYCAFIVARPNANSVQSEWIGMTVTASQSHTTHTWDGGKVTKQPTLRDAGIKTYTCTICGTTKTETVDRLESVTVIDPYYDQKLVLTRDGHSQVTGSGIFKGQRFIQDDRGWFMDYMDMVTSISIGEGFTGVGSGSFSQFRNLITTELPESLTSIEVMAFDGCTSLQEINIPQNVSSIGINAFGNCMSLKKVTVSAQNPHYCGVDNVVYTKDMTELVFCAPGRDGDVVIPEGVKKIDSAAFFDCGKLGSVTVPRSVTSIESSSTFGAPDGNYAEAPSFNAVLRVYSGSYVERYAKEHSLKYIVINECANGHTWDDGQVTTQATTSSEGVRTYTCTVCKATRVETIPALPAPGSGSLQNFAANKAYYNGFFRDVAANVWYSGNVAAVYQLGLMNGRGASTFAPQSNVTIAEAVTLAARLHSIYYTGKELFETYDGGNWYDPYVNYARNNGIIFENYNFDIPATRETFAHILAQALPADALQPVRSEPIRFADAGKIIYIGDVNLLCQAGVINGVQSNGVTNFLPQNTITRAEAAAIITRMAQPGLRVAYV